MRVKIVLVVALLALAATALAGVTPNALFSDGAVLQRGMPVPIWGTADPGQEVTVQFQGQRVSTVADGGRWMVRLQPLKAGGPFVLKINDLEIKDVLVGEVWVCGGQSNMEFRLWDIKGGPEALPNSADPNMRFWTIPHVQQPFPAKTVGGAWKESGPESARNFTGVGYFFGRELRDSLKVPIGLINAAWSGSPAQAWTSLVDIEANPILSRYLPNCGWMYNGMIRPVQPFAIRGVIFYQGEANTQNAWHYRTLFPTMIHCWRQDWGEGDFPFLFVQLAPFEKIVSEPQEADNAELREAQLMTSLTVPNTAMAVITDVGDPANIHPAEKRPVAHRLALAARALAYGQKVEYLPPLEKSARFSGGRAVITFANAKGGLILKGDKVTGFTIAGKDRKFYSAEATVSGDKVTVWSGQVAEPVAVRYGWAHYPLVNLYNRAGIPASPFRTDDFRITTQPK